MNTKTKGVKHPLRDENNPQQIYLLAEEIEDMYTAYCILTNSPYESTQVQKKSHFAHESK